MILHGLMNFSIDAHRPSSLELKGHQNTGNETGMGMAYPHLNIETPLYFYGIPNSESDPFLMPPVDSLTFYQGEYYIDIAYAPPYFMPEKVKLDYNILFMKVITVTRNFLEVEVNTLNQQTAWISRNAVDYLPWPEFLLNIHSIEIIDITENPLRVKPLDHAGLYNSPVSELLLQVIMVKGDWVKVQTNGQTGKSPEYAWVRWKKGENLLITYSILS
jgi:hypothetical protein